MAHAAFLEIPDPTIAAICSEAFEDDYVFSVTDEVAARYGSGNLYVGASTLLVATACVINRSDRTVGSVFAPTVRLSPADVTDVSKLYRSGVGTHQGEKFEIVATPVVQLGGTVDGIQGWGVREVYGRGRNLLAAHVVTRELEDGELTDALIFPRSFAEELPLIVRDSYTKMLRLKSQLPKRGPYRAAFDELTGPILRNEEVVKTLGNMLAASFLPTPEQNNASLGL